MKHTCTAPIQPLDAVHPAVQPHLTHPHIRKPPAPIRVWAAAICAWVLAACSSVPPYEAPRMEVPAAFKEAALFVPANPDAAQVPDAWWTAFRDDTLTALVEQLNRNNPSLQSSAAAVAVAQAALASSKAAWFPNINLGISGSRNANVANSPPGTSYNLQGSLSGWELDLWNRIGAGVDSADARQQASQSTLAAARLSLQSTLVQSYFSARAAQAQAKLLEQTITAYERSLQITQDRYQSGVVSAVDVAQASSQLHAAQAQLADNRIQRAQLEHALATLLGLPPAQFTLAPASNPDNILLPNPPRVPVQLPSQLLERRPDIAAAERQVAAANAQIGAARAAFFPSLTLGANAGFRSSDFGSLTQAANKFWSIGPALTLNLFAGGAQSAAVDSARATYDQTVAAYKQTVLSALQEVEDNLSAAHHLQEQARQQQLALAAANRTLDITKLQYIAGTVSYLNVVTAQTAALTAQTSLLNTQNRLLAATAQLLKNIAGKW